MPFVSRGTMTSASTFPSRLTKIDDLTRPDHYYLDQDDSCYFLGEYTARKGFAFSATNNLILNFKKKMDRRHLPEWHYKAVAIRNAAAAFRAALKDDVLGQITFVPIPPSKAKSDHLYDDRLVQMLRTIRANPALDMREIVVQTQSTEPAHDSEARPTPTQLAALYAVDPNLLTPVPGIIAIVDDVLTTGSHYRAVKAVLGQTFPGVATIGLFIARRVPESSDFEDIALIS